MAKINKEMIARILQHVGGAGNVAQAGNCMTRLRLTLRDESRADSAAIRQINGVMGVIVSDEQFQVVLGPGKAQSAAEMMNALLEDAPAEAPSLADVAAEKKQALKSKQTSGIQNSSRNSLLFSPHSFPVLSPSACCWGSPLWRSRYSSLKTRIRMRRCWR